MSLEIITFHYIGFCVYMSCAIVTILIVFVFQQLREKYGITDEMVMPFEPVGEIFVKLTLGFGIFYSLL